MERNILYFDKAPDAYVKVLDALRPEGFNIWYWDKMSDEEKREALPKVHYTINTTFRVTADIIKAATSLKMIQRTGVGINNVDVDCADEMGIPVAIVPRGNGVAVAEFEVLQILALYRHLRELEADTKAGEWPNFKYRDVSYEMDGKTIGFIGFGYIAREIAKRVKGFNCKIIYFDLYRASAEVEEEYGATYMPRDEVLKQCDILSIMVPLVPENRNMISMKEMKMMKNSAIIVNCDRGYLINEDDLYTALTTGIIAGAGMDTWADEPVNRVIPLFGLKNVIATPHASPGTIDTFRKCVSQALDNIVLAEQTGLPKDTRGKIDKVRDI
jgi:phosphoglycerate dehydrogenase-like enzyme